MNQELIGTIRVAKTLRDWTAIEAFADCLATVAADMKKHATKSTYMAGDLIRVLFPVKEDNDGGF